MTLASIIVSVIGSVLAEKIHRSPDKLVRGSILLFVLVFGALYRSGVYLPEYTTLYVIAVDTLMGNNLLHPALSRFVSVYIAAYAAVSLRGVCLLQDYARSLGATCWLWTVFPILVVAGIIGNAAMPREHRQKINLNLRHLFW